MASVTFDHVNKRFGDVTVLSDFHLEIPDGTFLALLGPSGSGKSTALRSLAGLEPVSEGRILIGDVDVTDVAPRNRDIAMVFQSYALYPHMTVFGNIAFCLQLHKVSKEEIDRRVRATAGILGIEPLLGRKPGQLSGGQRQRVALARAIVREPRVFLLDEPLSNLDAQLRVHTRAELIQLHQRLGTTFVYVTHDQVEAMTMAQRIAVLEGGRIQQVGTPQDLYHTPANCFVAGFIGSPAMNFLELEVRRDDTVLHVTGPDLDLPITDLPVAESLLPYLGRPIVLGIRPEHIYDQGFPPPGINGVPIQVQVTLTEWLGSELFIYSCLGANELVARVDPRTEVMPGSTIQLLADLDHLHFFDPETGLAIGAS